MNLEIKTYYVVHRTRDEWGHKGDFVGIFTDKEKAKVASENKGWYGGPGSIEKHKGFEHGENVLILREYDQTVFLVADRDYEEYKTKLQESGLAKLTQAEKLALGLE